MATEPGKTLSRCCALRMRGSELRINAFLSLLYQGPIFHRLMTIEPSDGFRPAEEPGCAMAFQCLKWGLCGTVAKVVDACCLLSHDLGDDTHMRKPSVELPGDDVTHRQRSREAVSGNGSVRMPKLTSNALPVGFEVKHTAMIDVGVGRLRSYARCTEYASNALTISSCTSFCISIPRASQAARTITSAQTPVHRSTSPPG